MWKDTTETVSGSIHSPLMTRAARCRALPRNRTWFEGGVLRGLHRRLYALCLLGRSDEGNTQTASDADMTRPFGRGTYVGARLVPPSLSATRLSQALPCSRAQFGGKKVRLVLAGINWLSGTSRYEHGRAGRSRTLAFCKHARPLRCSSQFRSPVPILLRLACCGMASLHL